MARFPIDNAEQAYVRRVIAAGGGRRFEDASEAQRTTAAHETLKDVTVPDGRFGIFRAWQGPSGTWHWGTDLIGKYKTPVIAPEDMTYVAHWDFGAGNLEGTNVFPPTVKAAVGFSGYGPCGLVAKGKSGVHHLLAHLDPDGWSDSAPSASSINPSDPGSVRLEQVATPGTGMAWRSGEQVGMMPAKVGASGPHVHWELRKEVVDTPATRGGNTFDPVPWIASDGTEHKLITRIPIIATKGSLWWLWVLAGVVAYDYSKRRRR